MKILINEMPNRNTQRTFFTDRAMAELAAFCEQTGSELCSGVFSRAELKEELRGADVLMGGWGIPVLDGDLLEYADRLRLVLYTGGSVAGFVTEETERRGITVCSGNRLYANSVAEGTIGYILLAQRRLPKIIRETEEKGWAAEYYTEGIRFKTVGIIGFGMVAKELAKMLRAFDCRVKIASDWFTKDLEEEYRAEKATVNEIFSTCDVVTLHESLTKESLHSIGKAQFERMKPGALFVNTARGPIIVEEALAEAVNAGRIRAILDVYDREPLPMDSCLRGNENIILIPHRGGPTVDVREYVTLALIGDLKRFFRGERPEHEIPWEYARNMTREKL